MTENNLTPEDITAHLKSQGIGEDNAQKEEAKAEPKKEEPVLEAKDEVKLNKSAEDQAVEKGWKPEGVKSAEEFLRAEPLYEEIKSSHKEIKELRGVVDSLKEHMDKQKELGRQQAIAELKAQKNAAIYDGDPEKVEHIEQQMNEYKDTTQKLEQKVAPEAQVFEDKFLKWTSEVDTYTRVKMQEFALQRDNELTRYNLPPGEHISIVEKDLKAHFPQVFNEESSPTHSAVESPNNVSTAANKKSKFADLDPEQKKCARYFENHGIMKVEDYIKQLKDLGEL